MRVTARIITVVGFASRLAHVLAPRDGPFELFEQRQRAVPAAQEHGTARVGVIIVMIAGGAERGCVGSHCVVGRGSPQAEEDCGSAEPAALPRRERARFGAQRDAKQGLQFWKQCSFLIDENLLFQRTRRTRRPLCQNTLVRDFCFGGDAGEREKERERGEVRAARHLQSFDDDVRAASRMRRL